MASKYVIFFPATYEYIPPPLPVDIPRIPWQGSKLTVFDDSGSIAPDSIPLPTAWVSGGGGSSDPPRSTRGRKPVVTPNPLAPILRLATGEGWFDDFVMGAIYTVVGASNGTLRVSPSHVVRALCMNTISVEELRRTIFLTETLGFVEQRTAQQIAQVARFALIGITQFLSCRAHLRERLSRRSLELTWDMELEGLEAGAELTWDVEEAVG